LFDDRRAVEESAESHMKVSAGVILSKREMVAGLGLIGHHQGMHSRKLVFAFFAAAILFSVIREWSAPVGCPRRPMITHESRRVD